MSIGAVDTSTVAAVSQVYRSTASTGAEQADNTEQARLTGEDCITLSSEGQQALYLSSLFGAEPDKPITIEDIMSFAGEQLVSFSKQFGALMHENGIDTSQRITLGHECGTGRVIVTNDHPQAEKIEALLEENPELGNTYTGATNALALARHAQEHSQFGQAYAENPQMAVAQYSYLFNTCWDASVSFSGDDYSVAYNRIPRQ